MGAIKELVQNFFGSSEGQSKTKRNVQNLAIFMIIGIALLMVSGVFSDGIFKKKVANSDNKSTVSTYSQQSYLSEYDALLENKIKNILSQMSGVGKVSVAITYSSGKEIVPAQDVKQNESNATEKDREGGVRNTSQIDTDSRIIVGQSGETVPVILKEIPPEVRGVVVVADGADNEEVKANISRAVSTALGISLSRIQVFPMTH